MIRHLPILYGLILGCPRYHRRGLVLFHNGADGSLVFSHDLPYIAGVLGNLFHGIFKPFDRFEHVVQLILNTSYRLAVIRGFLRKSSELHHYILLDEGDNGIKAGIDNGNTAVGFPADILNGGSGVLGGLRQIGDGTRHHGKALPRFSRSCRLNGRIER